MRVLVAGATGVIGRQLVPLLLEAGHEVVGLARSRTRAEAAERTGARLVVADALDRAALLYAVRAVEPDAVVHLLTAIPAQVNPRRMARDFTLTNRLRTEGTHNLLDAARAAGAQRFVAQSIAFAYDPAGSAVKNEDAPLWRDPPRQFAPVVAAVAELERLTRQAGGTVLRFGHLYGPGSSYAADGAVIRMIRTGKMPIVGTGAGVFSFVHARDAATAVEAALRGPAPGVFNIVDDEPTPAHTWLPELAAMLGAPAPRRVPTALARLAVGGFGVAYLTALRGASNARARDQLRWKPRYPSWREGFRAELLHDQA